jgi:hypothetical protein
MMFTTLIAIGERKWALTGAWLDALCRFNPWDSKVMATEEIAWCNNYDLEEDESTIFDMP